MLCFTNASCGHNLGLNDGKTSTACMHVRHEALASRGANEVTSCLLKHLNEMNTEAYNLILYSDSCGGQNRIGMLVHYCLSHRVLTFLSPKLTTSLWCQDTHFCLNDRDFGSIETARRKLYMCHINGIT